MSDRMQTNESPIGSQRENVLVTADWIEARLDKIRSPDPSLLLLEVDMEPDIYEEGHVPGAQKIDWEVDLAGELGRNIVSKSGFEELMSQHGITENSTVVLYGDRANFFAAHAYWLFRYYGHDDVRLMDGGRHYWMGDNYPVSENVVEYPTRSYTADTPDESIRAHREDVENAIERGNSIIDVRNPQEYRGDSPPADINDTTDQEGHIPGAENIMWAEAVNADGTFKPNNVLADIYGETGAGDDEAVSYCRIGERSSITWFVLHELLGRDAANYDGSWTDWASQEDAPIERGEQ